VLDALSIVLLIATVVILTSVPAYAHGDDNYWDYEWRSQDRGTTNQDYEFTSQVPGDDANGAFGDRTAEGGQKWNAIGIGGNDMHFRRNGVVANYNPFDDCSNIPDYKNGIHYRSLPGGAIGITSLCTSPGLFSNVYIDSFQISFESSENWYKQDATSGIPGWQTDLESVAAHEFGHVVGGWLDAGPYSHYTNAVNAAICPNPPSNVTQTMCAGGDNSATGQTWRRSLEEHDIDVFQLAYA